MAKTKPIGVRFDEELLNTVKSASLATSPQKALNLYERSYLELVEIKVLKNNKPENKAKIEADRKGEPEPPTNPDAQAIERRISEIQNELKSPPKNPLIGLRRWMQVRENEIRQLKEKLK